MKLLYLIPFLLSVGCAQKIQHPQTATAPLIEKEDSFVAAIENIKSSVAPIVCVQTNATRWDLVSIEGTAIFISADGSFVTPKHVIDGLTLPNRLHPCPSPAVYLPADGVWRPDSMRIHYALFFYQTCAQDTKLDLALCSVMPDSLRLADGRIAPFRPIRFDSDTPPEGTAIAFTGFPLSNVIPVSAIGHVAGYQKNTTENGISTLIVDRGNWPGASGSPVYRANGKVIGIVLGRGTGDGSGLTYARVSRVAVEMLKQQGKSPQ